MKKEQIDAIPLRPYPEPLLPGNERVFGTIGRKVRLVVLDSGGGDDSIHGCFADAELGRDGCPGRTFGG